MCGSQTRPNKDFTMSQSRTALRCTCAVTSLQPNPHRKIIHMLLAVVLASECMTTPEMMCCCAYWKLVHRLLASLPCTVKSALRTPYWLRV